jgi:hypothetical protein
VEQHEDREQGQAFAAHFGWSDPVSYVVTEVQTPGVRKQITQETRKISVVQTEGLALR